MHIGLVSDTHIPEVAPGLPGQILQAFRGVDLILHAGDIYLSSVLNELEHIAPVLAASGDDDYGQILRDNRVKRKHVLKLAGQTIWLVHEMPHSYVVALRREGKFPKQEDEDAPDIIVYGHEHTTFMQHCGGVLLINPGSPTFLNYRRGPGTVAILNLDSGEVQADILQL
ncbi:YfcE family phosphodiesterase [Chloroflexota bacterium]